MSDFAWQRETIAATPAASALIVTGDAGIGAGELALTLADKCCGAAAENRPANPDLLITLPEGGNISVAAVRHVIDFLSLAPVSRPRRAAVILRADTMNLSAANALLKTLEEPHPEKSLLLWTPTLQQLPATIISRCHVVAAPPPPPDEAAQVPGSSEALLAFCGNRPFAAACLAADWSDTLAGHFRQGAGIDINAAIGDFNVSHDGEWHWQQEVRRCVEEGAHLNPHCLEWAEKSGGDSHGWLEGLQKWVADGIRVACALPPLFFPAHEAVLKSLAEDNKSRWLDFYRHLLERRALAAHPLVKELFIREILYAYRRLCAD